MLRLHPDKRAKASELVHHAWLDGVVVQGEVEVIREVEEREREAKGTEKGKSSRDSVRVRDEQRDRSSTIMPSPSKASTILANPTTSLTHMGNAGEADAMKPVEDDVPDDDGGTNGDGNAAMALEPPEVIRVEKPVPKKTGGGGKKR